MQHQRQVGTSNKKNARGMESAWRNRQDRFFSLFLSLNVRSGKTSKKIKFISLHSDCLHSCMSNRFFPLCAHCVSSNCLRSTFSSPSLLHVHPIVFLCVFNAFLLPIVCTPLFHLLPSCMSIRLFSSVCSIFLFTATAEKQQQQKVRESNTNKKSKRNEISLR